jgi:hypothetical protein
LRVFWLREALVEKELESFEFLVVFQSHLVAPTESRSTGAILDDCGNLCRSYFGTSQSGPLVKDMDFVEIGSEDIANAKQQFQ